MAEHFAPRGLDLDDVGALIGQQLRGIRAQYHRRQIDDPYSAKRTRHLRSRTFAQACKSSAGRSKPLSLCLDKPVVVLKLQGLEFGRQQWMCAA
jgi:hypothetical protein